RLEGDVSAPPAREGEAGEDAREGAQKEARDRLDHRHPHVEPHHARARGLPEPRRDEEGPADPELAGQTRAADPFPERHDKGEHEEPQRPALRPRALLHHVGRSRAASTSCLSDAQISWNSVMKRGWARVASM